MKMIYNYTDKLIINKELIIKGEEGGRKH